MLSVKRCRKRQPLLVLLGIVLVIAAFIRGLFFFETYDTHYQEVSTVSMIEPERPNEIETFNEEASHYLLDSGIDTPLHLQTNERWADEPYGLDGNQTIAENGCGIASLAMVASALTGYEVLPPEVRDWAGNNYYTVGQGTDWRIFSDYAEAYGFQYQDLGTDIDLVADYLSADHPVIVSVSAGEFTERGHIMVLAGMRDDQVIVLDPNDSPEKYHYDTYYTLDDIAMQSVRFWTLSDTLI